MTPKLTPSGMLRAAQGSARRHWLVWGLIGLVVLMAYAVAFLVDEPLRRYTEAKMNRALTGYTARIARLDFHPHGFSLDLDGVVVVQDAHPDPPVARIRRLHASVHWRALLHGRLVGDIEIDTPSIHVDLAQARKEITDAVPVKERGWQEALEAIYPLKINRFVVRDGDVTYVDQGPFQPLELHEVQLAATNIRNIRVRRRPYPSDVSFSAVVFRSGTVAGDGAANFLAEPHPTFRGSVAMEHIELDYFKPIARRYNLMLDKGLLSANGDVEYGLETKTVELRTAHVEGVHLEYVQPPQTEGVERRRVAQAAQKARAISHAPGVLVQIDELRATRSTFGFQNQSTTPPYRVFVSDLTGTLRNLSNQEHQGPAEAALSGKFMGTGTLNSTASFRAGPRGSAFDVAVQIEQASLPAMNDLLRAYGRFDVAAGRFSFYSELSAKNGAVTGYVKPLFQDVKVYASGQEKGKPFFRKVYERVVDWGAALLENRQRKEVATKAEVSGRLDNPKVNTLEVVLRLVQNAFFKAILPGFDVEASRSERVAGPRP